MEVQLWVLVLLGLCALFVMWRVLPKIPWLLGAFIGFAYHLKAAKTFRQPRFPIWLKMPLLVTRAFRGRLNVSVMIRDPDIEFNYKHGTHNNVTGGVAWLDHVASALYHKRQQAIIPIQKNEPDLKINETLEITVGPLPGPYLVGKEQPKVLYLHPCTGLAETVIGLDLYKLFRVVSFYKPDIQAVVVVDPRALIDGRWNSIEYLSACNGIWFDKDHLLFNIPRKGNEALPHLPVRKYSGW